MRILALDTTTAAGSVAVLEAAPDAACVSILGVVGTRSDEAYSSRLFRQLEFLLSELKLTTAAFDLYAVAAGPGTFTGLRVGLTAVKGWAEIHQRPVAAVSALEAIAHSAAPVIAERAARIVALADARRGQVYGGIYEREADGRGLRRVVDDVVMLPAEFWEYLQPRTGSDAFAFATTAPEFAEKLVSASPFAQRRVIGVSNMLAPAVGEAGFFAAQRGRVGDALTLDAHYVRRTDAEMLFKK